MQKYTCKILKNEMLNQNIYNLVIETPKNFNIESGQFINLYVPGFLLPRPFSFVKFENNELSIIYKVNGQGTQELTRLQPKTFINILGPLGTGFNTNLKHQKVLLIGGGVGLPPILNLYESLSQNNEVKLICAFTNETDIFSLEKLKTHNATILVQNSKHYENDNPLQYLAKNNVEFDYIYACGPTKMLELIDLKYYDNKKGQISIEERMGCGHGTCYGCSKEDKTGKNVLTCVDGPVFDLGVLKWRT